MKPRVGIRREDKNIWERRAPIVPEHIAEMIQSNNLEFCVQPSGIRAIPDTAYHQAGARLVEDMAECPVVFAVKEIPINFFQTNSTYIFFAHVIKGQAYNMPMLRHILEKKCTLIDYEKITDANGRRLIFFGRYAGLAGMVDSLWALGKRLAWEGIPTPFNQLEPTHRYADATAAQLAIRQAGEEIARKGLPDSLTPFVCGFAGYGNVSQGAQEIYNALPVEEISPDELLNLQSRSFKNDRVYQVVFKESHTVKPRDPVRDFELLDFFNHPDNYVSQFERFLPHLSMLINAIYWTPASPRLVTKAYLRTAYERNGKMKLRVIGDISCDVEGAIEATVRATEPDDPVYVYEPLSERDPSGVAGQGPVIMAVDNLPCELPIESSTDFSNTLKPFIPAIAQANYSVSFEQCELPPEIKRAVITYRGELTPEFKYLGRFL